MTQPVDFETFLFECIGKGLDHFGSSFKYVVYHELENTDHIEGKEIIRKPLTFSDALDRMFGAGSVSIKKAIVRELATDFGLTMCQEDLVSMINKIREKDGSWKK